MTKMPDKFKRGTPPDLAAYRAREVANAEQAIAAGIAIKFQILVGLYSCPQGIVQTDSRYDVASLPALPLPKCGEAPWCSCVYSAIVQADLEENKSTEEAYIEYQETPSSLSTNASAIIRGLVGRNIAWFWR